VIDMKARFEIEPKGRENLIKFLETEKRLAEEHRKEAAASGVRLSPPDASEQRECGTRRSRRSIKEILIYPVAERIVGAFLKNR
jgi:hypothetical protein